ncbi:Zinc finger homeobox protein 4 [Dissostichus eleginoides]|uniref:Zinc finger homeobox protein 3 n=1 Tax=Dissostichus eleginoides TaxID=100907 RepID=A0AAD9BJR5_DISEL|nr:Zinc finger homeobox protein 4 [Dissostichus eleginoides]
MNATSKEVTGPNAMAKHSLLPDRQNESPPKRPKSAEGKTSANEQVQQCPYCNYSSKDANRMQLHVMSQHSMQPVIRCPLCQDVLSNKIHLQLHLTHLHSVAPDCVEKLIMNVVGPDTATPNNTMHPQTGQDKVLSSMDSSTSLTDGSGKSQGNISKDELNNQDKNELDLQAEELKPPKEASEAPGWKRASGLGHDSKSPDTLQDHLSELQRLQQQQQQLSVSDRHVYKYRCNHCSLAFKTMQKLQIHSQYHAIRAATMCSLCQRSFRTFLALKKHLETGHPELSEAEVQQLIGNLPLNGDITESEARALEEAQAFEHDLDKDDEMDQEEKPSPTESDSGSLLDEMGSEPKRTLPFRKGPNFTMEKFLDPSRPYKCTMSRDAEDQLGKKENRAKMENAGEAFGDGGKDGKDPRKSKFSEPSIPPPRIVSGARGNAAKALLENFGFELVIQYNENRQKNQKKNKEGVEQAPPAQPQPPPQQPSAPPPPSQVQLPVPMDMPLFSPMMMQSMQHPGLSHQLALQLPGMESLSSSDLTQLCQQQLGLDPNFLRQSQFKRPRTRITDDQLKILRANFDINNSPNEDQIQEMSEKSGLPQKVIKHWFRNTLFKERQRSKDSPYNFSIPPITTLEDIRIEPALSAHEYYRTESAFNKRSSRTRFTDFQLRVLQDFFDTNAYPKDDEIEQLSTVLNLPSRVIVVWFQNARQKARKSYENQADSKDNEKKELTNERYIRTTNMQYQCKKCNIVFPRIFDLITHQKKLCYKDEDEEGNEESTCEEYYSIDPVPARTQTPFEPPKQSHGTASSSGSSSPVMASPHASMGKTSPKPEIAPETETKPTETAPSPVVKSLPEPRPSKASTPQPPPQKAPQQQMSRPHSQPQAAAVPSSPLSLALSSLTNSLPHQMLQYQCDQCKIAFPTMELWQEHQHMHFLAAQNQFLHSQFLERPMDMPYMIFDPNNPLMASQLLSGGLPQIPSQGSSGLGSAAGSGSMKRKLDDKDESAIDKDGGNSSEEQHRDKRLRTTITPEQLEVLYEKYLLDSNPTRKMLDHIAREVGLKKRVVQVWFQNTRARERKGQFRAIGPSQSHKKCPFCRALFKAKSALDSHIRSRHWHDAKQAGFSLPASPMMNQDNERGESPNKYNFFDYPQLPTKTEPNEYELPAASSTPVKPSEAQLKNFLSPSSLKAENCDEIEGPNNNSAEASSYDFSRMDFDETSSINTAISDATTGDEGNNNEVESLTTNGGDKLSDNKSGIASSSDGGNDRYQYSMVSPALSFTGRDCDSYYSYRDDEMDDFNDRSESSSLADPSSPSPFGANNPFKSGKGSNSGDRPGHKRFRTQMSNLQLKVLKACFSDYRTPTMQECEMLGNEIGLPKRVVQVWFQNARAKEKKFKINIGKPFMISQGSPEGPRPECTLCCIKYTARMSVRDHIFSKQHIAKVQEILVNQVDREKDYLAPTTVRQLMAQQELDRMMKVGEGLILPGQQHRTAVDNNNALHGLSLPSGYPGLSGLPPVLLPGVNGPSSLPVFPPNTPALASPGAGMLGFPTPATPSPAMSLSTTPTKTLLQTPPPPPPPLPPPVPSTPLAAVNHTEQQGKDTERDSSKKSGDRPAQMKAKDRENESGLRPATPSMAKKREKHGPAQGKAGSETQLDVAQLQALQNALATSDPSSFLGGQFLPYFLPGFQNCFSPQLPTGVQAGGYFPPMCGMENLFPYGPGAVPQAAMAAGLSTTALLQQYQQYQQSLQDSLQKQQQQQQKQIEQHQKQQLKLQKLHSVKTPQSIQSTTNSLKPKEAIKAKDNTLKALQKKAQKKNRKQIPKVP